MREYQNLSLFSLEASERGRSKIFIFFWMLVQGTLWRYSPRPMYSWRNWLLRCFGAKIGKGVLIRQSAKITYPWNISVGDNSWIGDDCNLYSLGRIEIGSNVSIAHEVYFCTGFHDYNSLNFKQKTKPIFIGDQCWITNAVFIGPGVSIGRGAVVGARSSVFSDLPSGYLCFGTPAKPIKVREFSN